MDHTKFREFALDERNASARRFRAMGFVLRRFDVNTTDMPQYFSVRGEFACVCGRAESLYVVVHEQVLDGGYFNFYRAVEAAGSMSRDHLLADGYTVAQVDDMERRAEEAVAGSSRRRFSSRAAESDDSQSAGWMVPAVP